MNVLVSGWFSFENMGTTAGDLIASDLVCNWLKKANINFDIASRQHLLKGVKWENVGPELYSHIIFVCGPFGNGWPITEFLGHFNKSKFIGLNLSMLQSLHEWNPFDFLLERDSDLQTNPDITFGAKLHKVPVVGIVRAHKQKEYGEKAKHDIANKAIDELISKHEIATINIDTCLENNHYGLRTPSEIESLIAQADMIITTRLHGLVLSLKNGVPALAIDPIIGGAKITKQAKSINWPCCIKVDEITSKKLTKAFNFCLTKEAISKAYASSRFGKIKVEEIEKNVLGYLSNQFS